MKSGDSLLLEGNTPIFINWVDSSGLNVACDPKAINKERNSPGPYFWVATSHCFRWTKLRVRHTKRIYTQIPAM